MVLLFLDPIDGARRECIGRIKLRIGHGLHLGRNSRIDETARLEIRTWISRHAKILVESAGHRQPVRGISQMPFANGARGVAEGFQALYSDLTGSQNTAVGYRALYSNTNGGLNTAVGDFALYFATGGDNIGIGDEAGYLLGSGSFNIHIGNTGTASDDHTIKIGQQGTQTAAFIGGIYGTSISGGAQVYVNSSGQLGSASPAFVHTANAGNIIVRGTVINNSLCNGKPNAILIVTPLHGVRDHIFVDYIGSNWEIIYPGQNMQVGDAFNVFVANP